MEKEFQINENIVLKLEDGVTNIYINGEKFIQCKYLLTTIIGENIEKINKFNSIDEFFNKDLEKLELKYDRVKHNISSETEFWGHCSNIQAWVESGYDTRLLQSNLSFPLLRRLTELGDSHAKRVFKEEIAKRIATGYTPVIKFLVMEGYTDYLTIEELEVTVENLEVLMLYRCNLTKVPDFVFKAKSLKKLVLSENKINKLPESIKDLSLLEDLDISNNNLSDIPECIGELYFLKDLKLEKNFIKKLPDSIGNLSNLKYLNISRNILEDLPETMGNLKYLNKLDLSDNKLYRLPNSFENLLELKILNLFFNDFKDFPEIIYEIVSLEKLDINNNKLKEIPTQIDKLINLKVLNLNQNKLTTLPNRIGSLESLTSLSISGNNLKEIPLAIKNHKFLKYLYISDNSFKQIPKFLGNIESLKEIGIDNLQLELVSQELKEKLRERNIQIYVVKLKSIIRKWSCSDPYNPKYKYWIILYSDNSWSCTCPQQRFKNITKRPIDCDHIIKLRKELIKEVNKKSG